MPNNFSYLLSSPSFATFAPAAVAAERIFALRLPISTNLSQAALATK